MKIEKVGEISNYVQVPFLTMDCRITARVSNKVLVLNKAPSQGAKIEVFSFCLS